MVLFFKQLSSCQTCHKIMHYLLDALIKMIKKRFKCCFLCSFVVSLLSSSPINACCRNINWLLFVLHFLHARLTALFVIPSHLLDLSIFFVKQHIHTISRHIQRFLDSLSTLIRTRCIPALNPQNCGDILKCGAYRLLLIQSYWVI